MRLLIIIPKDKERINVYFSLQGGRDERELFMYMLNTIKDIMRYAKDIWSNQINTTNPYLNSDEVVV